MVQILAKETTIHSLGEIDNAVKYSEGKAFLDDQLHGIASKSPFGTELPSWIDTQELSALIAPKESIEKNTLLGIKSWRKQTHSYVAIGCYSANKVDKKELPYCHSYNGDLNVYLAVLEHKKGKKYRLKSKTFEPLDIKINYKNSQLPSGASEEDITPTNYVKFDFAPYKITKDSYAFGLRVAFLEAYSGGGANFETLVLFEQQGDKLVQIFAEPMYSFVNIAGEWHDDGTRDHDITEEKNIVIVQKHMTNGHYDLKVKGLDSKFTKIFIFDKQKNYYVAK